MYGLYMCLGGAVVGLSFLYVFLCPECVLDGLLLVVIVFKTLAYPCFCGLRFSLDVSLWVPDAMLCLQSCCLLPEAL